MSNTDPTPAGHFTVLPKDLLGLIGNLLTSEQLTNWRACSRFFRDLPLFAQMKQAQLEIVHISAGVNGYSHFVRGDGSVFAVGSNQFGELGLGHLNEQLTPALVTGPWGNSPVKSTHTGESRTLFLLKDGRVFATGFNGPGALGIGHQITQHIPALVTGPWGDTRVKNIMTGHLHTLFHLEDGRVFGAGFNLRGQLGLGHRNNQSTPIQITGSWGNATVKDVIAGAHHTFFLLDNGQVFATGANNLGQLGVGGNDLDRLTPVPVTGPWENAAVKNVYSGGYHAFFHLEDGRLFATGHNNGGQLGLDHGHDLRSPAQVLVPWNPILENIIAGEGHTFFLLQDGRVFTAGNNEHDQLGLGHRNNQNLPFQVTGSLCFNPVKNIITGKSHSFFVLKDNRIIAAGNNIDGQLGLGRKIQPQTPRAPAEEISRQTLKEILDRYDARRGFWRQHFPLVRRETTTVTHLKKLLKSTESSKLNIHRAHMASVFTLRDKRKSLTRRSAITSAMGFFAGNTTSLKLSKKFSATDHVISELRNAFR